MTNLVTLPGCTLSVAYDVNDAGDIVGASYTSAGHWDAWLWQKGNVTDLGKLVTHTTSLAYGIDEQGRVACDGGNRSAFLYQDGIVTDLGTLGGPTSGATRTNTSGQIVGWSYAANGQGQRAVLWSPVPELSPALVLLAGLLCAGGALGRKRGLRRLVARPSI